MEKKRGGVGRGEGREGRGQKTRGAIVDGGSEGRILYSGSEKPRRSGRVWWEEADELNNLAM